MYCFPVSFGTIASYKLLRFPLAIAIYVASYIDSSLMIPADIDILEEFMYLANSGVFQQLDILPTGNTAAASK